MKFLDLVFFGNIFKLCQKTVLAPANNSKQTTQYLQQAQESLLKRNNKTIIINFYNQSFDLISKRGTSFVTIGIHVNFHVVVLLQCLVDKKINK